MFVCLSGKYSPLHTSFANRNLRVKSLKRWKFGTRVWIFIILLNFRLKKSESFNINLKPLKTFKFNVCYKTVQVKGEVEDVKSLLLLHQCTHLVTPPKHPPFHLHRASPLPVRTHASHLPHLITLTCQSAFRAEQTLPSEAADRPEGRHGGLSQDRFRFRSLRFGIYQRASNTSGDLETQV